MLFNSIDFAIFLPIVYLIYWFVVNKHALSQNISLLTASYIFYGWWDWRFLTLIAFSSAVDYCVGIGLGKTSDKSKRKLLLITSILVNIGLLGFFKYYNFFLTNFVESFSFFGYPINAQGLNIILPLGISFYTFQTLSYTIDVYRGKLEPTKNIVIFFTFVSFFPQLVAGPIERATNLIPQFCQKRKFIYHANVDGLRQILWGLFKKIVIADNCALYANDIFYNYQDYSGSTLLIGAFFFAFQIYCDFSGYSDIAIGTARLFGVNLMRNFAFPYFSRDIAEFWRRWHISLSTWFRDYIYIPLGGSRGNKTKIIRNIFIVFVLSGLWHGANWTFVLWGALNAILFLPLLLFGINRVHLDTPCKSTVLLNLKEGFFIFVTFWSVVFAWVFFRAENIHHAFAYLDRIFSKSFFSAPHYPNSGESLITFMFIVILLLVEWVGRETQHPFQLIEKLPTKYYRWPIYFIVVIIIFICGGEQQDFIYFQF